MTILIYLLQVTTCLAIFYGFYHLFLRKETLFHTNRIYLMTTLLVSLILPLIKIYVDAHNAASNVVVASSVYVGNYVNQFSATISAPHTKAIPWFKILGAIYITGVAFMAVRLLLAFKQILEIRRLGNQVTINGHTCVLSDRVRSPFSFFNTIYLPVNHSFSEAELNEVIAHEMAHVSGWHTWDVLLMELLCVKLWPSPMIYLYRKSLKEVHEYVADAAVLKETPWENYAQLLVSQQHNQLQSILSNQLIYSQLKKRLLMMNKERSGYAARYKYLGIIPVLLIALILFSFREKEPIDISNTNTKSTYSFPEKLGIFESWTGIKSIIEADTLPEVTMISLRNSEPSGTAALGLEMQEGGAPIFPGCEQVAVTEQEKCGTSKLWDYINSNLVYPESLRKSGIEGMVVVRFTVSADGLVKNVSISKSLQSEADEVVMQIVKEMNAKVGKWQPATKEGKAIDVELSLPVKFALGDNAVQEKILQYAEELPRFPGCEHITNADERAACATQKLYEFIYTNIKYPKEDRDNNVEGQCIVQFVIGADGSISDINVKRYPSEGLKQEVERIIQAMADMPQKWVPARNEGKAVAMQYTLPVKFKLQDDDTEKQSSPAPAVETVTTDVLAIVPNPARENISVSIFADTHTLKIFDTSGREIFSQKVTPTQTQKETVSVSTLKPGQYVLQAIGTTRTVSGSFAIVK